MMLRATLGVPLLFASQLCGALESESVSDWMERQKSAMFEQRNFTTDKCHETVDEVHKSGKYTEESITPLCEREMKWEKCDFFSEALSLATSHAEFNKTQFCNNMDQAHFCSSSMDSLLSSLPVSDLAYGQCTRAEPKKTDAYCKKFQRMFAYAVQSEDLDTIRACYMIQAYSNMTASQKELENEPEEEKPAAPPPSNRIITSSGKELDPAGKGKPHSGEHRTPPGVTKFGDHGIVVQPKPWEDFGSGKGRFSSATTITAPAPAPKDKRASPPAPASEGGTIIVEPVAATEAGGQALVASARSAQLVSAPAQGPAVPAVPVVPAVPANLAAPVAPAAPAVLAALPVPVIPSVPAAVEMRDVVLRLPASADVASVAAQLGGRVRVGFLAAQVFPAQAPAQPARPAPPAAHALSLQAHSSQAQVRATAAGVPASLAAKPVVPHVAAVTHVAGQLKVGQLGARPAAELGVRAAGANPHAGLAQMRRGTTYAAQAVAVAGATSEKGKGTGEAGKHRQGKDNYKGFMSGFIDSF